MSNKFQINDDVRQAIAMSSYSDAGLASILGVGRDTVYRWRTGSTTVIRRQNLVKLADALGHYIKYNDKGVIEFIPQNPVQKNESPSELSNLSGDDMTSLIQTMQKQIEYLLEENIQLKTKINSQPEKKS
ncbi:MAG: helix-turn-helix domain-containing protein [Candidatus Marinimicrobia bacterium]|nr:helix-turn-helix domain-containing protein [Candidatus Neomarinimicrobiota bacterium]